MCPDPEGEKLRAIQAWLKKHPEVKRPECCAELSLVTCAHTTVSQHWQLSQLCHCMSLRYVWMDWMCMPQGLGMDGKSSKRRTKQEDVVTAHVPCCRENHYGYVRICYPAWVGAIWTVMHVHHDIELPVAPRLILIWATCVLWDFGRVLCFCDGVVRYEANSCHVWV